MTTLNNVLPVYTIRPDGRCVWEFPSATVLQSQSSNKSISQSVHSNAMSNTASQSEVPGECVIQTTNVIPMNLEQSFQIQMMIKDLHVLVHAEGHSNIMTGHEKKEHQELDNSIVDLVNNKNEIECVIQTTNVIPMNLEQSFLNPNDEQRFVCAGTCRKTFKHNDRTRTERASGATDIYCGPCKQQRRNKISLSGECGNGLSYGCCRIMSITLWGLLQGLYAFVVLGFVLILSGHSSDSFMGLEKKTLTWLMIWEIVELICVTVIVRGLFKHNRRVCIFGIIWSTLHILAYLILIIIGGGAEWTQ
eukprot:CAMPEP_0201592370 /NCGR_PEP_ID=MMETSP0190_2-20130828/190291_1 /ASSEMBLY_ACC=CAM_ASM_000263 /TAXON_ID=37353 /ORGANISM="Rosalina sp." /LENGTH=304 /DNA_ID=CAMNT_0048051121 /DNA_START=41 /DNA_END=953 /DNA_ORIENTATION=-